MFDNDSSNMFEGIVGALGNGKVTPEEKAKRKIGRKSRLESQADAWLRSAGFDADGEPIRK